MQYAGALPKVSVVVLSHRRELVGQAEHAARTQTYPNVQVLTQYDREAWPEKFNAIMDVAKGDYLVPLCDDDLIAPTYVEETLGAALGLNADIVYTDRRAFHDGEDPLASPHYRMHSALPVETDKSYGITIDERSFAFGSSLPFTHLVKKAWWAKMGGHDAAVPHSDTEWWYRSIKAGARTAYVPRPLFWYRFHPTQTSNRISSLRPALQAFHRKHFPDFGHIMAEASWFEGPDEPYQVPVCPPAFRVGYQTAHFSSLTTLGLMPIEKKPISDLAKLAIKLTRQQAEQAVNTAIMMAMQDAGVNPADGWRLNDQMELVREEAFLPPPAPMPVIEPEQQPEPVA